MYGAAIVEQIREIRFMSLNSMRLLARAGVAHMPELVESVKARLLAVTEFIMNLSISTMGEVDWVMLGRYFSDIPLPDALVARDLILGKYVLHIERTIELLDSQPQLTVQLIDQVEMRVRILLAWVLLLIYPDIISISNEGPEPLVLENREVNTRVLDLDMAA